MYSMPLNDTKILSKYVKTVLEVQKNNSEMAKLIKEDFDTTRGKGSFWYGEFTVPCSAQSSLDTFIKFPSGWRKGQKISEIIFLGFNSYKNSRKKLSLFPPLPLKGAQ